MDKVDELVERRAIALRRVVTHMREASWEDCHIKDIWKEWVRAVLDDPDLALIDRERNKERYLVNRMAIIPLADILKEKENGT